MEEEMRQIEEEFAFQEKWIRIFKRGKIFFQNIPEHLILRIITKGKKSEVVKKERNQYLQQLRKTIRSKYYFFLYEAPYGNFMEDLYSKEANHFRRECWNIEFLEIYKFPINTSIINHLQPIIIEMDQNGPFSENFNIPARTKHFSINYVSIRGSDFYKEIERFGSLPLKVIFRKKGYLELDGLFSTLKGITQERHLHHPLQFLTYRRESRSNYAIFDSWPMDSFFPSSESNLFYFIIVAKSDVGVSVIDLRQYIKKSDKCYMLKIMGIKSFDEWEEFIEMYVVNGDFDLKAGQTREESDKQLAGVLDIFSAQIASKFFEGGKLIYPPLAPEPTREFVEFLKKFEDFDIQPDKLAPHKPKWKKTEKLPELPRKLPEIHSNNWLIEAREVIKLRKFWMGFLQKGKYILELLPLKNVLDIARRIEYTRFPLLFSSTKWVNELIQNSASNFRIHGGSFDFAMICMDILGFKKSLKSLEFYYLDYICFNRFTGDIKHLNQIPWWVRERKIFVKRILFGYNCPLIEELFESLAREPESLFVSQYATLPASVKFSSQLKEIEMEVNFFEDGIKELIERFTGIEQAMIWFCDNDEAANETITHQLKTLKSKKCRSNILIRSWNEFHSRIVNYDPQFDLSQISETVFIFRSMARGRGGAWNYFVRLEQAGSGAVGIALYLDSIQVEEDIVNGFNIRCEYFPTMESFLDYFEREVGSKRRTRDWMQLREKNKTIEPREKDFKELKILTPYIHFNEQREADDLEEVRRRFFS